MNTAARAPCMIKGERLLSSRTPPESGLYRLYDRIIGDEDVRVCKDIPDEACHEQPRNFFAYLFANFFNKVADELASARLTLPWLFNALGVPLVFIGFLVPIREAGVLIPQLFVAAYVRNRTYRKPVWMLGASLSMLVLIFMGIAAWQLSGVDAGLVLLILLVIYSLARGLCSVSAKDVLGKTISKTRRGHVMGYSAALAGLVTLGIGLLLQIGAVTQSSYNILVSFLVVASIFWLFALLSFNVIIEPAGATEGGGNAFSVVRQSFRSLSDDSVFRQYVISRMILMSVALVVPFYVLLIQNKSDGALSTLGLLIIISGLASSLSAPVVGRLADKSSRLLMATGSLFAGIMGIIVVLTFDMVNHVYLYHLAFFTISLMYNSVRLGRKVYLVDMATQINRAQYVALSNTLIGLAMLAAGALGIIGDIFDVNTVILLFSIIACIGSFYIFRIKEVSG